MISQNVALKQLKEIEKLAKDIRLAADDWDEDWKTLIAILMSARTKDKKTIPVAEELFKKYNSLEELSRAKISDIENIIRQVNYYRTKSKNISELANILVNRYSSKAPHDFNILVELPGVGRKTANVFLAQQGLGEIGVDTHVEYISNYLGWTKSNKQARAGVSSAGQKEIEEDLKKLFPEKLWGKLNWILVRFGQTYANFNLKNEILDSIKKIK